MTPTRPPRQNTDAEIEALELNCQRLAGFNPELALEWIDGFLAAVAAGPRLLPPEEWLPLMCGDAFERAFADPDDQAQALHSLQGRLKVLCDQLDPECLLDDPEDLRLNPLIGEYSDEDRQALVDDGGLTVEEAAMFQIGVLWAEGFLDGVEAMAGLWVQPEDEEAQALFEQAFDQITALLMPADSDEWKAHLAQYYPKHVPTRDELLSEACMSVQDLRLFWVDFAPKPATRRVLPTPGRNDPCPCGSGKKYKKCHGADA